MYSVARTLLGAQSTAYDFAYTDEKYFTTRNCYAHAGMFAAGGAAGVADGMFLSGERIENSGKWSEQSWDILFK